ncbi:MAG: hypothetical protein ACFFDD_14420, partial [Promethearchaeota archaeon]
MINSRKLLGQVGILVLLALAATASITILGIRAWESTYTIIASDSLLAFLAIICAAYAYATYKRTSSTQSAIFFAALVTQGTIYIGSSVDYLLGLTAPTILKTMDRVTSDIFEVSFLGVLFLSAILLSNRKYSTRETTALMLVIVFGSLSLYGALYAFVLVSLSESSLIIAGLIGTSIAIIAFLLAGLFVLKYQKEFQKYDLLLLLLSLAIFSLASIPLFLNLVFPSSIWIMSLVLQAVGFFSLAMSVAVPWQVELGIARLRSYASIATLCFMALIPFIVFVLVESVAPGISFIFLGAYYL